MITVFFNEDGYYIAGEGVHVARRLHPACTDRGDKIFPQIHHTYKIIYLALCEIRDMSVKEDVMVYNDSRIIDEINHVIEPFDQSCEVWLNILQRHVIPAIRSVIFFRKKPTNQIKETIATSHKDLLVQLDARTREDIMAAEYNISQRLETTRKQKLIKRFKQSWFGKNNGNR